MKTDDAIITQWTYKPEAMRAMLVAVLKLALARGTDGVFSANDLPTHGEEAHGGSGIAGSVVLSLKRDGVISPCGIHDPSGTFLPRIVLNACGNKIGVYRLAKPTLARTLLDRHQPAPVTTAAQLEFARA
jgi:hypothetical protein